MVLASPDGGHTFSDAQIGLMGPTSDVMTFARRFCLGFRFVRLPALPVGRVDERKPESTWGADAGRAVGSGSHRWRRGLFRGASARAVARLGTMAMAWVVVALKVVGGAAGTFAIFALPG